MNGVDVSQYQGVIDFATLRPHIDFMIIKATEGAFFVDPQFGTNRQSARDAKLLIGYYHFARFDSPGYSNTPEQEAQHFIDMCATKGALLPGEVLVLDYEVHSSDPTGHVKRFCDYVYNATGVRPWVYSYVSLFNTMGEFGPYAVWVAAPSYPYEPYGSVPVKFGYICQQYGEQVIDGIAGATDVDHFYGDAALWKSYGLPEPTPPAPTVPTPAPVPKPPIIDITPPPTPKPPIITPPTKPPVINKPIWWKAMVAWLWRHDKKIVDK